MPLVVIHASPSHHGPITYRTRTNTKIRTKVMVGFRGRGQSSTPRPAARLPSPPAWPAACPRRATSATARRSAVGRSSSAPSATKSHIGDGAAQPLQHGGPWRALEAPVAGWCSQSSTHMPAPPPKHVQQSSGPPINTRAILLRGGLRRATGAGGRSNGVHACARAQRAGLRAGEECRDQRQREERPGAHERAPLAAGAAWPANESNAADALLS